MYCWNLISLTVPASVRLIGENAFMRSKITQLTFENGIERIESFAFEGAAPTELILPESLKYVGKYAFGAFPTNKTTEKISIPKGIMHLYSIVRNSDKALKLDFIPENLRRIEDSIFRDMAIEQLQIPEDTEYIGTWAFSGCQGTTSLKLNNKVKVIEDNTFAGLDIESLEIPDCVEYIGRYAFSECEKLRHVTLGKNVACISRYAFKDCPIERIEMLSNIRYIDQNAFDDDQNTIFAVERGSYAAEWAEKKGYAFEFILTPEEIAYMEKCRREEEARKAEEERLRIEEEERKKREEKERRRKEEERIAARKQAYEQLLGEKKHWQEVFDANKSALFGRSAAARKEAKAKLEKIENKLKGYSDMVGKNGER